MAKDEREEAAVNEEPSTVEDTGTESAEKPEEPAAKGSRESKKEKKKLEEKEAQIAALKEQLDAQNDKYLRMMAEYDNFRKRAAKEKEGIYSDAVCDTVTQMLPLLDNLERALTSETDTESATYKGVEMCLRQGAEIFAKLGITEIEALGKTFDPNLHNAVMHDEDETKGENEITAVFQKGYRLGDKVIRHSVVKVTN